MMFGLSASVIPPVLLHPRLFKDLARKRDRHTNPVIDRGEMLWSRTGAVIRPPISPFERTG
jgi:hypothetical protein